METAPAAPPAAATPVVPTAATTRAVHPAARWVAHLFSPMSLRDQGYCTDRFQRLLWGTLLFSYPVAYWMGNVLITMGAVCAATVVCVVAFVPNWYQHPDPLLKYADDTDVYYYYRQYEAAKKAACESAAGTAANSAEKNGGCAAAPATRKST